MEPRNVQSVLKQIRSCRIRKLEENVYKIPDLPYAVNINDDGHLYSPIRIVVPSN